MFQVKANGSAKEDDKKIEMRRTSSSTPFFNPTIRTPGQLPSFFNPTIRTPGQLPSFLPPFFNPTIRTPGQLPEWIYGSSSKAPRQKALGIKAQKITRGWIFFSKIGGPQSEQVSVNGIFRNNPIVGGLLSGWLFVKMSP